MIRIKTPSGFLIESEELNATRLDVLRRAILAAEDAYWEHLRLRQYHGWQRPVFGEGSPMTKWYEFKDEFPSFDKCERIDTKVEMDDGQVEITAFYTYTPGYEAPMVHDHDMPGFSDPGAGPEIYFLRAYYTTSGVRLTAQCVRDLEPQLRDAVLNEYKEAANESNY